MEAWPRPTASMVLPTPGGPMNNTLVASSRNRRVASSLTRARSTEGWASKSKSVSRQGAGSDAKRARPAGRRAEGGGAGVGGGFGGGALDGGEPFQEGGVAELGGGGVVELSGERFGR